MDSDSMDSSQMYLEAMEQLKELNEKREKENEKIKETLLEFKKQMISCYGIVRLIDMMYQDIGDLRVNEITILIESLRDYLSQFAENNLISESIEIVWTF